jgi:hypothetical protein
VAERRVKPLAPSEALAFVARHGAVMQSARHAEIPSLAQAIAGAPIAGSWWGHKAGKAIFAALVALEASKEVVWCRLVDGKLTLLHRRLWASLAKLATAGRVEPRALAAVVEEHTPSGKHVSRERPLDDWLPPAVAAEAAALTVEEALSRIGAPLAASLPPPGGEAPRSRGSAGRAARGRRR